MARRYALVIGVGENYEVFGSLPAAVADAEAMAALLREQGQFEVLLVIGSVTLAHLTERFNYFFEQAAGGEALIYYSGHGFPYRNMFGQTEVYLALSDCEVAMEKGFATAQAQGWPLSGFNAKLAEGQFQAWRCCWTVATAVFCWRSRHSNKHFPCSKIRTTGCLQLAEESSRLGLKQVQNTVCSRLKFWKG